MRSLYIFKFKILHSSVSIFILLNKTKKFNFAFRHLFLIDGTFSDKIINSVFSKVVFKHFLRFRISYISWFWQVFFYC